MGQPGSCQDQGKTQWLMQFWSSLHQRQQQQQNQVKLVSYMVTVKSKQGFLLLVDLSWDGPDPKDTATCPYPVEFYCKPSPAESLNSLESGRLFFQVELGAGVRSVAGRLVNKAKSENLDITYILDNSNSCTARFSSEDAFHWQATSKGVM